MELRFHSLVAALIFCLGCAVAATEVTFTKKQIQIKSQTLEVEWAETEAQLQRGLMFRQSVPEGTGMFFVFDQERTLSFWMKNTFVPLSIAFIDSGFVIVDIQDMEPVKSVMQTALPSYSSRKPARYALEVPKGWFAKHKITVGDRVRILNSKSPKRLD
jgi:uncharacterized membrane protein (UPF0127 family)